MGMIKTSVSDSKDAVQELKKTESFFALSMAIFIINGHFEALC